MFKVKNLFGVLLVLLVISALPSFLLAQPALPYSEPFNYSVGALIPNDGWAQTGINTGGTVQVTSGSLSYTGLPTPTGNKVALLNGSGFEDPGFDIIPVGNQTDPSSVFVSFILNVINPGTFVDGDYIQHVSSAGTSSTDFHSRVFIKQGAGGIGFFNMGIRHQTNDATQWDTTELPVSTPVFIVVSYDFVPLALNDTSHVWLNPALGLSSPPTPTLTSAAAVGTDLAAVGRINLRQGSASTTMSVEVDEMRIGTDWIYVTPTPVFDWALY